MANSYSNRYVIKSSFSKVVLASFLLVMASTTMYFANYLINRSQSLKVGASSSGQVDVFFEPAILTASPDALVNLWVTTDRQLGFAAVEVTFDIKVVSLSQEVVIPNSSLKRVIKKSTMAQANQTGKLSIVVAVDPTTVTTAPTGSFALANLKFKSVTTTPNLITNLGITNNSLQLIDSGSTPFTATIKTASMTLNPIVVSSSSTPTINTAPIIKSSWFNLFATKGKPYSAPFDATDRDLNDNLTMVIDGLPSGLSMTGCKTENWSTELGYTCTVSGTPTVSGKFNLSITVTDGKGGTASNKPTFRVY